MSLLTYIFLMVMLLSTLVDKVNAIDNNMIYLNMIILTLYFVLYSRYLFKKDRSKLLYSTFIIVTIVPLIISINNNWNITQLMDSYYNNYDQIENTLDGIRKKDKRKFYRIEREESMTLNDPSWYNYYGMSTFSSMTYQDMAILQHKLGIPGNEINSHYYKQNTPIYDLMFNIDYYIGESNDLKRYTSFKVDNDRVYKFKYSLGLMYGVNKDIQYLDIENDNPFIVQNDYIGKATNIQDVLVKMDYIDKEEVLENGNKKIIKYTLINPDDNVYFYTDDYSVDFVIINNCIYYKNDNYNDYNISRNSEYYYYDMESYSEPYVINFNSYEDEINIYVGYSDYIDDDFYVYTIDNDKLDLAYSLLKNNKLEITKFMESKIIGEIQLDNDMMMYTSIPYDSGWHVLIDNKKVETYHLAKSLLMFEVPKGKHKIVVYYRIKGFYLGLMLTILSSIVVLFDKKIFKKKEERLN